MERFAELLEQSVLVSGGIALMCVGTMCYLAAVGQPVPDILGQVVLAVVGFFFGSKVQQANDRLARTLKGK